MKKLFLIICVTIFGVNSYALKPEAGNLSATQNHLSNYSKKFVSENYFYSQPSVSDNDCFENDEISDNQNKKKSKQLPVANLSGSNKNYDLFLKLSINNILFNKKYLKIDKENTIYYLSISDEMQLKSNSEEKINLLNILKQNKTVHYF